MSDAETLRRAAEQIRNDHGGPMSRYAEGGRWLPVAAWLDNAASRLEYADGPRPEFAHAEVIARAYLGES